MDKIAHHREILLLIDDQQRLRFANDAARRWLSRSGLPFTVDALSINSLREHLPSQIVDSLVDALAACKPVRIEVTLDRPATIIVEPTPDKGAVVIVTHLVAPQQAHERFHDLFYASPQGMAIIDGSGHFAEVNNSFCTMFALDRSILLGKNWRSLLLPAASPAHEAPAADMLEDWSGHFSFERRFQRGNGTPIWVRVQGLMDQSSPDRAPLTMVQVFDITNEKRAEAQLVASEQRFRQIAETIDDVFWINDTSINNLIYISPAYERIWGRSTASLYEDPSSFMDAVHDEDRANFLKVLEQQRDGDAFCHEYRILRPDGSVRWIWDRGFPVVDEDGNRKTFIGLAQDITEKKRSLEEIAERSRNNYVAQLTGELAHEFNNKIGIILALADELRGGIGDRDATIRAIIDAGNRATITTKSMLAIGQRQRLHRRPLNINNIVRNLQLALSHTLGPLVDVQVELCECPIVAQVDTDALAAALRSLILNARDASPRGGRIVISTHVETRFERDALPGQTRLPDGQYAVIEVRDWGTGMSAETRSRAFEPFFSTKASGFGYGLGLSAAYGLARQCGGAAEIRSELGHGSAVRLILPLSIDLPSPPQVVGDLVETKRWRILVVDDEPDLRSAIARFLLAKNYDAVSAASAPEALTIMDSQAFDIVLTDVVMRPISGLDFAIEVARRYPETRIILMTGFADAFGSAHHEWPVLEKPVAPDQLLTSISYAMSQVASSG